MTLCMSIFNLKCHYSGSHCNMFMHYDTHGQNKKSKPWLRIWLSQKDKVKQSGKMTSRKRNHSCWHDKWILIHEPVQLANFLLLRNQTHFKTLHCCSVDKEGNTQNTPDWQNWGTTRADLFILGQSCTITSKPFFMGKKFLMFPPILVFYT